MDQQIDKEGAAARKSTSLIWDMTLPWNPAFRDAHTLPRLRALGLTVVGLTVGTDRDYSPEPVRRSIEEIERLVAVDERFLLVRCAADVQRAAEQGRLGLELNFQGTRMLGGDIGQLQVFHQMGVRHIGLVWNAANEAGGSSTDSSDAGLTPYGRRLIREMESLGIMVDGAHAGRRTTLDAIWHSDRPFIISHTNCRALDPSYKNASDAELTACAQTGGVVGISGFGSYLGDASAATTSLFQHIDHAATLIGAQHVGLGLDYVTNQPEFWAMVARSPHIWPGPHEGAMAPCRFVAHEQIQKLATMMRDHGYRPEDVAGILGGNWLRIAQACWTR